MDFYKKMKDSGIEWVGEIPTDWKVIPAGIVFKENKEKNVDNKYSNPFSFKYGEIVEKSINGEIDASLEETFKSYQVVYPNTIMINGLNLNYDFITQRVALVKNKGIITSTYLGVIPDIGKIDPYFAMYLLKAYDHKQVFHGMGSGIRKTLSFKIFKNIKIVIPNIVEQKNIVIFIDSKVKKIDELIDEAKSSIEDYKKWKSAIIYEAVTKGLDPNVEMKDLDILGLKEIPYYWSISKIRNCLAMPITDGPHTTPELYLEGIPFVSAEAVSCGRGKIDFDHIRGFISESFYQECCKKYIPAIDDIYMIKSGATTGKVAIVDTDVKFTIWSPLAVFRANTKRMIPKYMFYFLQSDVFQKQVELNWNYGTQQNIGMRTLETLKVCIPPIEEQKEIACYLDKKCKTIDLLVSEKESLISDLEDYKKALIYEVVTGKRRVC